jgi:kinesin family protein 11
VSDADETSSKPETPVLLTSTMDLDETPEKEEPEQPSRKRRRSNSAVAPDSKLPKTMPSKKMAGVMEGRENLPPSAVGGRRFRNRSDQS